jgi:hypothetical protein
MSYVKVFGPLAVAVALLAFAGGASASSITSPTGTVYTGSLTAVSEGSTSLDGAFVTVTCGASHVEGKVEKHGESTTTSGKIAKLTFTECNFPVTVLKAGTLEAHPVNCSPYCEGTLTSNGAEIKIQTSLGECVFTTSNTDIGKLTGTDITKSNPTLDIGSAAIPRTGGSFLCGSSGTWTGSYKVTTPATAWGDA